MRGSERTIRVGPDDLLLNVVIAVEDRAGRYRLEITRRGTGQQIWSGAAMHPDERYSELSLFFSTELLVPADYILRLFLQVAGGVDPVAEYGLTVEVEAE